MYDAFFVLGLFLTVFHVCFWLELVGFVLMVKGMDFDGLTGESRSRRHFRHRSLEASAKPDLP